MLSQQCLLPGEDDAQSMPPESICSLHPGQSKQNQLSKRTEKSSHQNAGIHLSPAEHKGPMTKLEADHIFCRLTPRNLISQVMQRSRNHCTPAETETNGV